MSVPQYTTPTFTLTFNEPQLDLTQAKNVYVTFKAPGDSVLTKSGSALSVTAKTIDVYLTQEETGKFKPGSVEIQANWIDANGGRAASTIVTTTISEQLLKKVIS